MTAVSPTYLGLLLLSGLLPLGLIVPVFRRLEKRGATGLALMLPAVTLYQLSVVANMLTGDVLVWFVTGNVAMLATGIITAGWFLLTAEYTETLEITRPLLGGIAVYLLLVQVIFWTQPLHQLAWVPLEELAGDETFIEGAGIALRVINAVQYAFVLVSFILILREAITSVGLRQKQSTALFASLFPGTILFIVVDAGWIGVNVTPLGVVAAVLILAWALFYADFLDIVPIGLERAVEELSDVFFTLDRQGRVIDANRAAQELFEFGGDWNGKPAASVLEAFPEVRSEIDSEHTGEVTITDSGNERVFDITVSPIYAGEEATSGGEQLGRTVSMREITELRQREQELAMLKQVFSRVFRHNVRNELGATRGQLEVIEAKTDGSVTTHTSTALESTDRLLGHTEKARDIERVIDRDNTTTHRSVQELVSGIVVPYRQEYPDVTIRTAVDDVPVQIVVGFEVAIENAVQNAIEHNRAQVTVELTTEVSPETVELVVSDDGSGIPENELAVLDAETETALSHGSGLGLWVMKLYVEKSGGHLDISRTQEGTEVRMVLQRS